MCGITGLWYAGSVAEGDVRQWIERMAETLAHRGPDASGIFFDSDMGIGFGHRRLSILDLSERGSNRCGLIQVVTASPSTARSTTRRKFARTLNGKGFASSGEGTPIQRSLLEAVEAFGVRVALERFRGMFAFALWDSETRRLSLVRDRLGHKTSLVRERQLRYRVRLRAPGAVRSSRHLSRGSTALLSPLFFDSELSLTMSASSSKFRR